MRIKRWNILFLLCCFWFPLVAWSAETLKVMSVTSIYDGDTFTVTFPDCNQPILCERVPIRIDGIDAPEMRGKCQDEIDRARAAKQYLVGRLRTGKLIELRNPARDKYFRLRAELWIDGSSVGGEMLKTGLARDYSGQKRSGWCPLPPVL